MAFAGFEPAARDDPNDRGRAGGPRFGPNDPLPPGAKFVAVGNRPPMANPGPASAAEASAAAAAAEAGAGRVGSVAATAAPSVEPTAAPAEAARVWL